VANERDEVTGIVSVMFTSSPPLFAVVVVEEEADLLLLHPMSARVRVAVAMLVMRMLRRANKWTPSIGILLGGNLTPTLVVGAGSLGGVEDGEEVGIGCHDPFEVGAPHLGQEVLAIHPLTTEHLGIDDFRPADRGAFEVVPGG
jgi:hypothetical protein